MAINQKEYNKNLVERLVANPELLKDKLWRLENLYWIINKDGEKSVFKMNRAQRHFFDNYLSDPKMQYHRHIILKSRQLGFTTFIDLYIFDEILFNTNREGLIIAHKVQDAAEIFDRKIDFALRNLEDNLKDALFKVQRNSAKKVQVLFKDESEDGSTSSLSVATSGRSGTFHYVHVSEFAKMCVQYPKNAFEVETGTFPAVPFDGFIFIESTAEGMAGRFYEMFHENWLDRDKITKTKSRVLFLPHFYNWQYDDMEMKKIDEVIPVEEMEKGEIDFAEYQQEHNLTDLEITYYYMKWLQAGGKSSPEAIHKLRQEFPTTPEEAFLATGQSYFPQTKVFSMLQSAEKGERGEITVDKDGKLQFQETSIGSLTMFRKPEKGITYTIGGDTAEGLSYGDSQVLYVINNKTEDCDAVYVSKVPPDELVDEAYNLGKFYNWALLGIESNKDGLWVNDGLDKKGYINLYYRKSFDDITKQVTKFFGWKTTSATRPFSLAALKAVFLKKTSGFPTHILNEMITFVRNQKGKPEALQGKNDDVIMAAAIGYAILQEQGGWNETNENDKKVSMHKIMFGE